MEIFEKRPTIWLIAGIIIASFFAVVPARAAWYSTYDDLSNTHTTSTINASPRTQNIYLGDQIGNTISKIMFQAKGTAGDTAYLNYKFGDTNDNLWDSGAPTLCQKTITASLAWYECATNITITKDYLGLFEVGGANTIYWGDNNDGTLYPDGKSFAYKSLAWVERNTDIQIIYEVLPVGVGTFWVEHPIDGSFVSYDYESATPTVNYDIHCASTSSLVAVYDQYSYLAAKLSDFTACVNGWATIATPVTNGINNWVVLDSHYLDASYDYWKKTGYFIARSDALPNISSYFKIIFPEPTGFSGPLLKFEDLYDDNADGVFNFIFQLTGGDISLGTSIFQTATATLTVNQYDSADGTGASEIYNRNVWQADLVGSSTILAALAIPTTPHFYKASLAFAGSFGARPAEIWWWGYTTTSVTAKNNGISDSLASSTVQLDNDVSAIPADWACKGLEPDNWYNIWQGVLYAGCWIIVPDFTVNGMISNEYTALKADLNKTFLFSWPSSGLYTVTTTITTTIWLAGLKDFFLLAWLKEILSAILYFLTVWYVFRRLRNFFKH